MKGKTIFAIIAVALIMTLSASCDLKRNNPLDNLTPPPRVTGLTADGSGPGVEDKYVELTWTKNPSETTDGYYVYRGLAYNAEYARVDTVGNVASAEVVTRIVPIESPGFYYFKVSAFKQYPSGKLEGSLSEWAIARVDN
jgi:hypothetical protein